MKKFHDMSIFNISFGVARSNMFIYRQKQKGMVLICAIAILAVLSIMATSFVRMMTLNLQAAKNHLNYVDAKFAAIAGIEDAKAKMWAYMLERSESTSISFTNDMYGNDEFTNSGTVGRTTDNGKIGRYDYNGNQYEFRIRDNQGKLNLNSHRPHDITNATYIQNSNRVMNNIIQYLAEECDVADPTGLAEALRPVNSEIKTFNSMEEVELIVRRFGNNAEFLNNVCVNSVMDSLCYVPVYTQTSFSLNNNTVTVNRDNLDINEGNTTYYREYRSPININTTSNQLLTSLIRAIKATVYTYAPTRKLTGVGDKKDFGFTKSTTGVDTEKDFGYGIQTDNIDFSTITKRTICENIASTLLTNSPYHSMAKIEEEISKLTNISSIERDVLKANFNPNVRENFYNGAASYVRSVQKSDLYSATDEVPTHSTELCVWDLGYVDIEANGIIKARVTPNPNNAITVAKATIKQSISFGTIMSLTSYNDFPTNNNAWIFPELPDYEKPRTRENNRNNVYDSQGIFQNVCGYVQGRYHEYSSTTESVPENFVRTKDGILMKHSLTQNAVGNVYAPSGISASTIGAVSGSIEFWIKLTEDYDKPTMCALFSASYKNPNEKRYIPYPVTYNSNGYSNDDGYHDGIQMYIYKNTKGELRISRLFFCGYFNSSGNYEGIKSLAVDVSEDKLPDTNRKYPRRDIWINLSDVGWKANEWNYIKVYWKDNDTSDNGFYATVFKSEDNTFQRCNSTHHDENTTSQPKFCIINEKDTANPSLTRVQMNSMLRKQKSIDVIGANDTTYQEKRLFRFATDDSGNTYLPGNSTINDIKTGTHKNLDSSNVSIPTKSISTITSYSIPFSSSTDNDPNRNPWLNFEKNQVTTWGVIGSLTWIAYPESTSGYITMSSNIHEATVGNTDTIIAPTNTTIITSSSLCTARATFSNDSKSPTVLDSVTLNILYPVIFSSTIVQ